MPSRSSAGGRWGPSTFIDPPRMAGPASRSIGAQVLGKDWTGFVPMVPGASTDPFLERIRCGPASPAGDSGGRAAGAAILTVLGTAPDERDAMLERFVQTELATVLELEPDDLPLDQPLHTVGLVGTWLLRSTGSQRRSES